MRIKGEGEQIRREGKCRIKQDERRETKSVEKKRKRSRKVGRTGRREGISYVK